MTKDLIPTGASPFCICKIIVNQLCQNGFPSFIPSTGIRTNEVVMYKQCQTEMMLKMCSKVLIRAIGEVLPIAMSPH